MRTVTVNRKTGKPHSKTSRILGEFMKGRDLTSLESIGVFGVYRLADVVFKLRKRGYPIVTELKKDPNGSEYANYRLINKGDEVDVKPQPGFPERSCGWSVDSVNTETKSARLRKGPCVMQQDWSALEVIRA
jgi:hypothetical protein